MLLVEFIADVIPRLVEVTDVLSARGWDPVVLLVVVDLIKLVLYVRPERTEKFLLEVVVYVFFELRVWLDTGGFTWWLKE